MQTLKYWEAHLSEKSSQPGRAWGSVLSASFPGTCKAGSVLGRSVPNLQQIKSQEIKHKKSLGSITGTSPGSWCQSEKALPQVFPVLSIFVLHQMHSFSQLRSLLFLPCTPLSPASLHAVAFPARMADLDPLLLPNSHKFGNPNYCTSRYKW